MQGIEACVRRCIKVYDMAWEDLYAPYIHTSILQTIPSRDFAID